MLSAMLFSSLDGDDHNAQLDSVDFHDISDPKFETEMEKEGLRYLGGFIAHKFPQHQFLGEHVTESDTTWIGEACRKQGRLMTPSETYFEQLNLMERLFKCCHGDKDLKPGTESIHNVSKEMSNFVPLPNEFINYFVKCRLFFRIRI